MPIAEIILLDTKEKDVPLKGAVASTGDIVSPMAEDKWEVQKVS